MNKNNLDIFQPYLTQLTRIYVYYCSFGNKQEYSILKIQNYQRLLSDLQLPNYQILIPQLDIIFYTNSRSTCLDLNRFINTLYPISCLIFTDEEEQKGLQKLLSIHMQSLYEILLSQTEFGHHLQFISAKQSVQTSFVFLKQFQQSLLIMYSSYFNKQGKQGTDQELKTFFKLSRELDFTPKIICKGIAYLIFLFLREKTSKSVFHNLFTKTLAKITKNYKFNFMCFLQYLIILSHVKANSQQQDVFKIYRLLQSIQVSVGCQKLYKSMKFKHFYLSQQELQQCSIIRKVWIQVSPQKAQKSSIKYIQTQTIQSPIKNKLGLYYDPLKSKFTKLCLKNCVETNFYLSFSQSKKFIQKICPCLSGVSVDLMIKAAGRLNFEHFILLLDTVSNKIGINNQTIYEQVLVYGTDNYNISLIIQNMKLSKQQQSACNEILSIVHSYLKTTFEYYQSNKAFNLQTYLKMFRETTIIPFILLNSQAVDIYKYVVKVQQAMTFDEFMYSLKITIVCKHFDFQLEGTERLIYLLQKFCESKKGESLMKKNMLLIKQHPLYKLRLAFSDIYKLIESKMKNANRQIPQNEDIK